MRGYLESKFRIISPALDRSPTLSNRAIAKLTGTNPATVAKIRAIRGLPNSNLTEASGRRARGRPPIAQYYEERLPNDEASLYRVYHHTELLYVGISLSFLQRLATHSRRPWWREVTHITTTHFSSRLEADIAERIAIRNEQPKYNIVGKTGKLLTADVVAYARQRANRNISDRYRSATAPPQTLAPATPGRIRRPTGRIPV